MKKLVAIAAGVLLLVAGACSSEGGASDPGSSGSDSGNSSSDSGNASPETALVDDSGGSNDGNADDAEGAAPAGTFTFASNFATSTLDPDLLPIRQMTMYLAPIYDSLTRLTGDLKVVPGLATSWESGSDTEGPYLDLTLRSGLTFDDGTSFTAKTVALNVKRSQTLDGSTNAPFLSGVTVEQIDPTHVRLRDSDGVGDLPRVLAGPAGMMISDKAISGNEALTSAEAGIGPFNLKASNPNRVTYTANPDYWDEDAAGVQTLVIEYLSDDAKLNAVRSGEVDVTILPAQMVSVAKSAGYRVEESVGTENYMFSMNSQIEPFDDPNVRKAVNLAVDRKGMCESIMGGLCVVSGQFFGAGGLAYDEDLGLNNFPYNPNKAKQLIQGAGAEGATVDIVTVAGISNFVKLATVLQQELTDIGLQANVLTLSPPQVAGRFMLKKDVAIGFGATGNAFDPSVSVNRYMMPSGHYNPGRFEVPGGADLAAKAIMETDPAKRIEMYRELSGLIKPTGFLIPLLSPKSSYVIAGDVTGWKTPWAPSFPDFRGVSADG